VVLKSAQLAVLAIVATALAIGCGSSPDALSTFVADAGPGGNSLIPPQDDAGSINFGLDSSTNQDSTTTRGPSDACVGESCVEAAVCGDGIIETGETCDDGNSVPGDGCSGTCQIEPGYACPNPGKPCVFTGQGLCGDGKIEGTEGCDDGNTVSGDGCSSTCQVEAGYSCTIPGQPCTKTNVATCGDGMVETGEQCDDGNTVSGDGCSSTCQLEKGWTCPTPGTPCKRQEYCGDGIVEAANGEQCDDGNTIPGDGCSGTCQIEPGYACPDQGLPCVYIWVCGNGKVDPGETCDDGNTVSGDGCSSTCQTEAGYTCPDVNGNGGPCVKNPTNVCGDGHVAGNEQCDDGNTISGDGCSSTCALEPGWTCPTPGQPCTRIEYCGDGVVELDIGEQCDDGNTVSGDGCSSLCQIEANWVCPVPDAPCIYTVVCGDGKVQGNETCDDGNTVSGDGCSSTCQVEPGWKCPTPDTKCIAKACGDGIIAGNEQCDDGNTVSGDGCSATCQVEAGWACVANPTPPPASVCHQTTCGDGIKEGSEECDDGNTIPYDGCSPTCTIEPHCSGGTCTAVCGDGLVFPGEQCDDGNTISGDGCSSTCTIETGWTCTNVTEPPATTLAIPILYRDMLYNGTTTPGTGNVDFEHNPYGASTGLVESQLGSDSEPVWASDGTPQALWPEGTLTAAQVFCWWYHQTGCTGAGSTNPYDQLVYRTGANNVGGVPTTLTLTQQGAGQNVYQFSSTAFYPIDGLGWDAPPPGPNAGQTGTDCAGTTGHNFSFTSELHYPFTYSSATSPTFDFTGDDDVYGFINGQLVIDLGGVHAAENKNVTLTPAEATTLGMTNGGWYSIDLFQAERHTCGSDYTLTIGGFTHVISQCTTVCGDGIVAGNEQCDLGTANNTGAYGGCNANCTLAPYCGDDIVETPPEQCDNGVNQVTYGGATKQCGPGCLWAPYCGDGKVSNGEQCDQGSANGSGYGYCTSSCTLGPRCGDGIVQNPPEQCDDGISNGAVGDPCSATCILNCGDGVIEPPEQCDNGTAGNTGGYDGCNANCTLGPYCGDGIKEAGEQCDDGTANNNGSYGGCNANCTLAGYCGDGILQDPPETCDQGAANSATAYGPGLCTNQCTPAPYCGDHNVDGEFGEVCDDGVNNGQPGSCTSDCKMFVPLPTCGNGIVDPGEQCDDGANNGVAGDPCDSHCQFTCGNGVKDPGEQCDNGVNNGSYGTCNSNCTLAGYCGDGIKNGPEQCDDGSSNVSPATAYGPGVCTTACKFAPYCGDGEVESQFGEQCDSTPSCSSTCQSTAPQ
jgi:fibro-slime domain-containing protein